MTIDARLDELAVLYVGLAHGIDGRMHHHEYTRLAHHLQRWRHPGDRRSIPDLVEHAVRSFNAIRVIEAVETLGRILSERDKRVVLDDLAEIALSDQRFLAREAEYIGRVAYEWGVHTPIDDQGPFWTVLAARDPGAAREAAVDLAQLFVAAAHEPDQEISTIEWGLVVGRLAQWLPDLSGDAVDRLVREARATYPSPLDGAALSALVRRIRAVLPEHQRSSLLMDLRAIAMAEGPLSVGSRAWLAEVEDRLGTG